MTPPERLELCLTRAQARARALAGDAATAEELLARVLSRDPRPRDYEHLIKIRLAGGDHAGAREVLARAGFDAPMTVAFSATVAALAGEPVTEGEAALAALEPRAESESDFWFYRALVLSAMGAVKAARMSLHDFMLHCAGDWRAARASALYWELLEKPQKCRWCSAEASRLRGILPVCEACSEVAGFSRAPPEPLPVLDEAGLQDRLSPEARSVLETLHGEGIGTGQLMQALLRADPVSVTSHLGRTAQELGEVPQAEAVSGSGWSDPLRRALQVAHWSTRGDPVTLYDLARGIAWEWARSGYALPFGIVRSALSDGYGLTGGLRNAFEDALDRDESNVYLRWMLAGANSVRPRSRSFRHASWLIRNRPEMASVGRLRPGLEPDRQPAAWSECALTWLEHLGRRGSETPILRNAARWFEEDEPELSEALLS